MTTPTNPNPTVTVTIPGTGPQGPIGPVGPMGPAGPQGLPGPQVADTTTGFTSWFTDVQGGARIRGGLPPHAGYVSENPGFTSGTYAWEVTGTGIMTVSPADAGCPGPAFATLARPDGDTSNPVLRLGTTAVKRIRAVPGHAYQAGAFFKLSYAGSAGLDLYFMDVNGVRIGNLTRLNQTIDANVWTWVQYVQVAPAGSVYIFAAFFTDATAGATSRYPMSITLAGIQGTESQPPRVVADTMPGITSWATIAQGGARITGGLPPQAGYVSQNPGFIHGTFGWEVIGTGGILTTSPTDPGCPGPAFATLDRPAGASTVIYLRTGYSTTNTPRTRAVAGHAYQAGAFFKLSNAGNAIIDHWFMDVNGTRIGNVTTYSQQVEANVWTWVSYAVVAPVGTFYAYAQFYSDGTTTNSRYPMSLTMAGIQGTEPQPARVVADTIPGDTPGPAQTEGGTRITGAILPQAGFMNDNSGFLNGLDGWNSASTGAVMTPVPPEPGCPGLAMLILAQGGNTGDSTTPSIRAGTSQSSARMFVVPGQAYQACTFIRPATSGLIYLEMTYQDINYLTVGRGNIRVTQFCDSGRWTWVTNTSVAPLNAVYVWMTVYATSSAYPLYITHCGVARGSHAGPPRVIAGVQSGPTANMTQANGGAVITGGLTPQAGFLNSNPSFSTDTSGWTMGGQPTHFPPTVAGCPGLGMITMSQTTPGTGSPELGLSGDVQYRIPAVPGHAYQMSGYVQPAVEGIVYVDIWFLNAGYAMIGWYPRFSTAAPANKWTWVYGTAVAPPGTVYVTGRLLADSGRYPVSVTLAGIQGGPGRTFAPAAAPLPADAQDLARQLEEVKAEMRELRSLLNHNGDG